MLKKEITYKNFDGKEVTETLYFNLTKAEIIEWEVEYEDGLINTLQHMVEAENTQQLVLLTKKLLIMSYGEKSADGNRFMKTKEITDNFTYSAAYAHLYMLMAEDDKFASEFIIGVLPHDLSNEEAMRQMEETKAEMLKEKEYQKLAATSEPEPEYEGGPINTRQHTAEAENIKRPEEELPAHERSGFQQMPPPPPPS